MAAAETRLAPAGLRLMTKVCRNQAGACWFAAEFASQNQACIGKFCGV